jgi:hypothetical protein
MSEIVMVKMSALTCAGAITVDVARARKSGTMRDIIQSFKLLCGQLNWPDYNKKRDATKRRISR